MSYISIQQIETKLQWKIWKIIVRAPWVWRYCKIGLLRRVLHNTRPVKSVSVVKSAIGLLAASHSDIQGVRITKSFSPGWLGVWRNWGWFYAHLLAAAQEV